MPILTVYADFPARDAYLLVYKQEAIDTVNQRTRDFWAAFTNGTPWVEMVQQHRAMQAYAYLNDPDAESHLPRYGLIVAGVPSYGANHTEVAEQYISETQYLSSTINDLYEDRRHAVVEHIPAQSDKPQVDTVVNTFLGRWIPGAL